MRREIKRGKALKIASIYPIPGQSKTNNSSTRPLIRSPNPMIPKMIAEKMCSLMSRLFILELFWLSSCFDIKSHRIIGKINKIFIAYLKYVNTHFSQ